MSEFNSLLPADGGSSLGAIGGVRGNEQEVIRSIDLLFLSSPGGNCGKRKKKRKKEKRRKPLKRLYHLKNAQFYCKLSNLALVL